MNPQASQPPSIEGTLFVVAAPSGAGKSTLVNALLEREPAISLSISHTTRPPRPGEMYGRHYYFVEREEFEREIAEGIFLEHAEVHGNLYGTSRTTVNTLLTQGRDVLLEIDWQGARQIRKTKPDCVSVFILPPSAADLEKRLHSRAQDSDEVIRKRMSRASHEMSHWAEYDYIVINHDIDAAFAEVQSILKAERLKRERRIGLVGFVRNLQSQLQS